jgi:hypothetical protein
LSTRLVDRRGEASLGRLCFLGDGVLRRRRRSGVVVRARRLTTAGSVDSEEAGLRAPSVSDWLDTLSMLSVMALKL